VRCDEKRLEFGARIDLPSPCWVRGDPTRLRQVLHNLLGNAIKFTEHGRVDLLVVRRPDGPMEFRVRDSGPGIAPDDLPHIFDAFWQAPDIAAMRGAGTGLGLNIAREISRAMGGEISCSTEPGRGSEFVLTVPLPAQPVPKDADVEAEAALERRDALSRARILLAEDNDVNALVIQAMLARHDCEVTRVAHGADAVRQAMALDVRPDVILMDSQMPVMDGGASACWNWRRGCAACRSWRSPPTPPTTTARSASRRGWITSSASPSPKRSCWRCSGSACRRCASRDQAASASFCLTGRTIGSPKSSMSGWYDRTMKS
jgi:CheY-like chemotaxis protein